MKFRVSGIAAIAAGILLVAPGLAQAEATKVFDGAGLSVKPASLTGWTNSGADNATPVLIGGRSGSPRTGLGPIDWQFWKKNKAVGKGRGSTVSGDVFDGVGPWNGSKVRVTAHGQKNGIFRKLTVFQWTAWMKEPFVEKENYKMTLHLVGSKWVVDSIAGGTS